MSGQLDLRGVERGREGGGEGLVKNVKICLQTQKYICGGLLKEISVVGS